MNHLTLDEMQILAVVTRPRTRDDIIQEVLSRWPSTKSGASTVRATISSLAVQGLLTISGDSVTVSQLGVSELDISFRHVRSLYQTMGRALGAPTWD